MDLQLKYTGFCIVYVPLWHMPLMMPSEWRLRLRTWRIEDDGRTSPDGWKTVNCSTKGERQQDNGDKKRLARQHPSDLLPSLTREQDRRRQ